jgi:2,4-diaminopentanoate dehydrogenase
MVQRPVQVAMYGLGDIGREIAARIRQQPHLTLVGAIDSDPAKIGKDLGVLLGLDATTGVVVDGDGSVALRRLRPDVVVIATTSFLRDVFPLIRDCFSVGARVVTTCEQLVYPQAAYPEIAKEIDAAARRASVAVLGVGINPGFVMDMLPILLTAPSSAIRHIRVARVVDASTRRATLQHRIGAGLDLIAFRDWLRRRTTPHIGLKESLHMIADALGWQFDQITETAEPILAERWLSTPFVTVAPGQVAGIHQAIRGYSRGRELLHLDWRTAIGMEDTHDAVTIDGTPPIDLVIRGGIHGDQATASLVMRAAVMIMHLPPGLRTVLDLPVMHYTSPWLRNPAFTQPIPAPTVVAT